MRLKKILSCLIAAAFGMAVWVVIKVGYALPGVLPTSDLFVSVVTSGFARPWMAATNGQAGMLIAVLMRAFPWSTATGLITGAVVLRRFKHPGVLAYSVLFLPLISMSTGYLILWQPHGQQSAALVEAQQQIYLHQIWVNFAVLIWFFIALYLGNLLARGVIPTTNTHPRHEEATTQQAATGP